MDIKALAADIYNTNKEKGFWDKERNMGEAKFLIISELSEAVEAHRKGNFADLEDFYSHERVHDYKAEGFSWADCFKLCIKDTVNDELADAAIRILDLVEGSFDQEEKDRFYYSCNNPNVSLIETNNFAEALLKISCYITKSYDDKMGVSRYFHLAFSGIRTLAAAGGIDLFEHMKLKLRYNKTRARLHGKAY